MNPIIIIGTGLAGYSLAREFRKLDRQAPLTLVTGDDGGYYSKPMLSNALTEGKTAAQLLLADAAKMGVELNAEIITHARVEAIDATNRRVSVDGNWLHYRDLVLAIGASPIRLPLKGEGAADVLSVNNLGDYARFRERLETAERVAIIGPGLIGCEFANDLTRAGKRVAVIGPDPHPISTLLPEAAGHALQAGLAKEGVQWQLRTVTGEIERNGRGYRINLENGAQVAADLILSAVGLRPNVELARAAGLEVNRGITTDRTLRTSAPGIYALGDCAEIAGHNLPFVLPLMMGARALAKTLAGQPAEVAYPAMPVAIKTWSHPVVVAPAPRGVEGSWQVESQDDGVKALFKSKADELLGFALTGPAVSEKQALSRMLPPVLG